MKLEICKTAILSGAMICFLALGLPAAVKAGPTTNLPPPTAAFTCEVSRSTLSAADCARFVEIIRHMDRVSAATLDNFAFLEEIQTELVASTAYQDYLNQELSDAERLALQTALERTSKFLDALSNFMKKISDTSDALVQNIR